MTRVMSKRNAAPEFSWASLERPFTCLAPMEDVTDTVFRRIVARVAAPDVFFTEFTSADGLQSAGRAEVSERLRFTDIERPIVAQIWGADPANFYRTAIELADRGFDGIDINMGCPASKITKKGCCGALTRDPRRASEMIHATVAGASGLPVSVKTRLGYREANTEEWCGFLLEQPIDALTVHGRTVVGRPGGRADWNQIAGVSALRDRLAKDTVVIGNGDVTTREALQDYPSRYNVDGVMVGRGIFHDLHIFDKTGRLPPFQKLSRSAKLEYLEFHLDLHEAVWAKGRSVHELKKFVKVYVAGFAGAAAMRDDLMAAASYDQLRAAIRSAKQTRDRLAGDPGDTCKP